MRAPWRVFRDVRLVFANGEAPPEAPDRMDVVPLPDVELLRRKAVAWEYAVKRGHLSAPKIRESQDFARFVDDVDVIQLGPRDVLVVRMPDDLDREAIHAIADQLRGTFPDNRCLMLAAGFDVDQLTREELLNLARSAAR